MFALLWIVAVVFVILLGLYRLLLSILIKYLDRVAMVPLMRWLPFYIVCWQYFDNSDVWAKTILLVLMKTGAIEAREMEDLGDEEVESSTYNGLLFHSNTMEIYEFRLKYHPRRKRKIKLMSRDWFEPEPVPIPVS